MSRMVWVKGAFDGHLLGIERAATSDSGGHSRRYDLSCLDGRLQGTVGLHRLPDLHVGTDSQQPLRLPRVGPIWIACEPRDAIGRPTWYEVDLEDVVIHPWRHRVATEGESRAVVRVEGTLYGALRTRAPDRVPVPPRSPAPVHVPGAMVAAEPIPAPDLARTPSSAPSLPLPAPAPPVAAPTAAVEPSLAGCATGLVEFCVFIWFWLVLGWLPAAVWWAIVLAGRWLGRWRSRRPLPSTARWPGWLAVAAAVVPLLGLLALGNLWLKGECDQPTWAHWFFMAAPVLLAGWLGRTGGRRFAAVLWTLAIPLLWVGNEQCGQRNIDRVRDWVHEQASRDPDADLLQNASRHGGAAPRLSVDGALAPDLRDGPTCGKPIHMSGDLLFNHDDARLRPSALPALRKLARVLRRSPGRPVQVEGHADDKGKADYNQRLSERRARTVADWLVAARAVAPSDVQVLGRGASLPLIDAGASASLRRLNRRVEVVVRCPAAVEE